MKRPEEIENRRDELLESADDAPEELASKLEAQAHILDWVMQGDFHPPDGDLVGHLEHDPEIFDEIVLAGRMGSRTFVGEKSDEPGRYALIRRTDI